MHFFFKFYWSFVYASKDILLYTDHCKTSINTQFNKLPARYHSKKKPNCGNYVTRVRRTQHFPNGSTVNPKGRDSNQLPWPVPPFPFDPPIEVGIIGIFVQLYYPKLRIKETYIPVASFIIQHILYRFKLVIEFIWLTTVCKLCTFKVTQKC